ncbi:MAG: FAD-dependent oxidoreductase [Cetobacterium sp.]|uniref:NAD(P)/FAD-dependent oxidoreductase n=1 Tax=unclassified Cetobacterium TaxID=2630983 RepID=UPI00163C397B|nr:FAD-dependent oxidoreductase [Cetobacterium sp. 2A]MBC2855798.1 FAD-dependent oxidoreductase [Cetobacterium sp. 2A]MBC2857223.1 FAD-dependent oxidoreductase [Cetobacterium sp. 2A]MBC2857237.1 FAD-dependent oxidoreductase [Cetobacterium sp. 2A]
MENIYDVIILGAGPAGLAAALYTGRANLKVLVLEKPHIGSLLMAHKIDNYPGHEGLTGHNLQQLMKNQVAKYNVQFKECTFLGFDIFTEPKIVKTDIENFKAKSIIIATGWSKNSSSKVPGEQEFLGKGVSYCATCDGAFTRNLTVSLFGKGEEVAEEALFLTRYAKEILIFVNDNKLNCDPSILSALETNEKVKIITNSNLKKISGSEYVESVEVEVNGEIKDYKTDYTFLYLGTKNPTELFGEVAELDAQGYLKTDDHMRTKIPGVYAAGDVRSKVVRQVTTATADGTIAGMDAIKYVLTLKK